jgi:hypothetical protein
MSQNTALTSLVREAGYEVQQIEQLRSNRWLVHIRGTNGDTALVLAQQRTLITSADVQDLAELLHLQRIATGYLLALNGSFSSAARDTANELRQRRVILCHTLPHIDIAPASSPALGSA